MTVRVSCVSYLFVGFTRSLDSINDCRVKKRGITSNALFFLQMIFKLRNSCLCIARGSVNIVHFFQGISFMSTGVIDESLEVGECEIQKRNSTRYSTENRQHKKNNHAVQSKSFMKTCLHVWKLQ